MVIRYPVGRRAIGRQVAHPKHYEDRVREVEDGGVVRYEAVR